MPCSMSVTVVSAVGPGTCPIERSLPGQGGVSEDALRHRVAVKISALTPSTDDGVGCDSDARSIRRCAFDRPVGFGVILSRGQCFRTGATGSMGQADATASRLTLSIQRVARADAHACNRVGGGESIAQKGVRHMNVTRHRLAALA